MVDGTPPWESDPIVAPAGSFTGVVPGAAPKPQDKTVSNGMVVDPNNATAIPIAGMPRPHVLSSDEVAANKLDPTKIWQQDATGSIKAIGDAPQPFKVGDTDEISHAFDVMGQIQTAKTLAGKPLSTGTFANEVSNWPIIGGIVGQNHANLQTSLAQIGGDLRQIGINRLYNMNGQKGVGTIARSNAEQQALQSSLAAIGQAGDAKSQAQPDYDTLVNGLNSAQQFYARHVARLIGANPDDPAVIQRIVAAQSDPAARAALVQGATASPSNPPPVILNDEGGGNASLSTKTQTVTDPKLEALAPRIGTMIASGLPDDRILQVLQANGVDPSQTNIQDILQFRHSNDFQLWQKQNPGRPYPVGPAFYTRQVPFSGGVLDRAIEGAAGDNVGRHIEAFGAGAGDAGTLGAENLIFGKDFAQKSALLSETNPKSFFAGELASPAAFEAGSALNGFRTLAPQSLKALGGQSLLLGGVHGFINAGPNASIGDRLLNAAEEAPFSALSALATYGALRGASPVASGTSRALGFGGDPALADTAASVGRFSRKIGPTDMDQADMVFQRAQALDRNAPGAVALTPRGQDYLAASANKSPGARVAATNAETAYNKQLPTSLGSDIHAAISQTAGPEAAAFLDRPAIEVRNDIQGMAGREYETGIAPIANDRVTISPDFAETLGSEPVKSAIADALGKSNISTETRALLRSLPQWLKEGVDLKNLPITVDSLKTIATALDRRANGLADGSEGRMALRDISGQIRQQIGEQFPEYAAVNQRYSGRMGQIDAMMNTRDAFLSNNNKAMDALHTAGPKLSDEPGPPEFGAENAPQTPSTRAMAMAGAREAVERQAGSNSRGAAANTAQDLANGVNQGQRTRDVFPPEMASNVEAGAGQKAQSAQTLAKVTSGATWDATQEHLGNAMQAAIDMGVGAKAAMVRNAFRGMSGLSSADAARVVDIFTRAGTGGQALDMLRAAYGIRRAQMIAARVVGYAAGNYVTQPRPDAGYNPPPNSALAPAR